MLQPYNFIFSFNFIHDCLIFSETLEEHKEHVRPVLQKFKEYGITINPRKLSLTKNSVNYLGHTISHGHFAILQDRIDKILSFKSPRNLKELHKFTSLLSFYAKFIHNYSRIVKPLNKLKQKGLRFVWTEIEEKCLLTSPPILALPDFDINFVLTCDASQARIGAVLQNGS